MSEPCLRENIVSLGEYLCWCMQQYGSSTILAGAAAYVGSNSVLATKVNYFYTGDYANHKLCIEAALAYVGALTGDGAVHLESGVYLADVDMDEGGVTLKGDGWGTTLNSQNAGHGITISAVNCCVRDIEVRNDATGADAHDGINITAANAQILHVLIGAADRHGIYIDGGWCMVNNCHITNIGDHGILVDDDGDNAIINGNQISGTGDDGMHIIAGAMYCIVTSNRVHDWVNEGIDNDEATTNLGHNVTNV